MKKKRKIIICWYTRPFPVFGLPEEPGRASEMKGVVSEREATWYFFYLLLFRFYWILLYLAKLQLYEHELLRLETLMVIAFFLHLYYSHSRQKFAIKFQFKLFCKVQEQKLPYFNGAHLVTLITPPSFASCEAVKFSPTSFESLIFCCCLQALRLLGSLWSSPLQALNL